MKSVKRTKNIKVNSETATKSGTVLIALGTIIKAGAEIAKTISKSNKSK